MLFTILWGLGTEKGERERRGSDEERLRSGFVGLFLIHYGFFLGPGEANRDETLYREGLVLGYVGEKNRVQKSVGERQKYHAECAHIEAV
jgi:hypothetical protein